MKRADHFNELRHEIRSRLQYLLGYGEILKEDARESPEAEGLDINSLLYALYSGAEVIRRQLENFTTLSPEAIRETINAALLEIYGASRELRRRFPEGCEDFLCVDIDKILAASDGFMDFLQEGFSVLSLAPAAAAAEIGTIPNGPKSREKSGKLKRGGKILIVDNNVIDREILSRHLGRQGHVVVEAESGVQALAMLAREDMDLVILDIMLPDLNGYQLLKAIKSGSSRGEIPVIMLSAIEDPESIARCLALGAEDFLSKSFEPVLLKARIEATLERKRLRDQERIYFQALLESRKALMQELSDAARYVRHLLPEPMRSPLRIDWRYFPSEQLGGDSFGYHQLDDNHIAVYLLDVSGHGIGASLLSVSVLNILRNHAVADADFYKPASVISSLNRRFRMEEHSNMYFTLWYSVYSIGEMKLRYSTAGAPPGVLIQGAGKTELLKTPGTAVGIIDDAVYETKDFDVSAGDRLYLFSDGTYEIRTKSGGILALEEFYDLLGRDGNLDSVISGLRGLTAEGEFEDDLSLVEIVFPR